jgi:hypothetical protein
MENEFNGIIKINGCAEFKLQYNYDVLFLVGSKAFIKSKALRGIIENIVIKKSFFKRRTYYSRPQTFGLKSYEVAYLDTFNRFWIEDELVLKSEALDLAEIYWNRIRYESEYVTNQLPC